MYKFSLFVLSAFFFSFDVWQLCTSSNALLAIVAGMCLLVSVLGHAGILGINAVIYGLVALAPIFLLTVGIIPGVERVLGAAGDFQMSALATAMSAVIPTVGAALTASVIWLKRQIFN
ncbi:hypothetical protein D3C84_968810 [compost metagenome]